MADVGHTGNGQTGEVTLAAAIRRYFEVVLYLLIFTGFGTLASTGTLDLPIVVLVSGALLFRGTRVPVRALFENLEDGATVDDFLEWFPGVQRTQAEFTPIGKWLKATQLDEIPQFVNVLRGDMSLVGPRPIRPVFFEELAHELPSYWQRLVVRPGLTGFAQVRRGYETPMAEKLAHDLEWIADRSVRLYLYTVLATGWRVLKQSIKGLVGRRA